MKHCAEASPCRLNVLLKEPHTIICVFSFDIYEFRPWAMLQMVLFTRV